LLCRETNGTHSTDSSSFRKQTPTSTLSDTSPSPPSNIQNTQQETSIDDEQRQKREIAKRREEDRKRREVRIEFLVEKQYFNLGFFFRLFVCLVSSNGSIITIQSS